MDGTEHWTNLQLDEVALPIVLAWQLGRTDGALYRDHIKKAADFIVNFHRSARSRRRSAGRTRAATRPARSPREIAGLVCAADIARRNGDTASADRYAAHRRRLAEAGARAGRPPPTGPYSPRPYYLRLTKDGKPNAGTTYNIGDSGPTVDQRKVVDPSFLELVRLGVKRGERPGDPQHRRGRRPAARRRDTPSGRYFWHRFNFDGYGEQKDGEPVGHRLPANPTEAGRTT